MFCLLPMRLPSESGRFQTTACLLRSMAQSSRLPVRRSVATLRNTRSFQMTGVEPLKAGSGTFQATFSVALQVVGSPFSALTPSSEGPRHCGQLSAARETPIETTNAAVNRRFRTGFSLYRGLGLDGTMMAVDITVTVKGIFDGRGQLAVPASAIKTLAGLILGRQTRPSQQLTELLQSPGPRPVIVRHIYGDGTADPEIRTEVSTGPELDHDDRDDGLSHRRRRGRLFR